MSDFSSIFRREFLIHREISAFLAGATAVAKVPGRLVVARVLWELPDIPMPDLTEAVRRAAAEVGREIDMDCGEYPSRDGGDAGLSEGSRPSAASLAVDANRMEGLAMDDRESRIRQRAYRLWEQDGWPTGMEAEHWTRAERELFSNGGAFAATGGEPVSEAATQSASAGKRPAVRSKSRAAKSPGATSSRGRSKPPQ